MASKPSQLRLTYFDGRGRGEICRLILAHAKKNYEDKRITFEQWGEFKPRLFFFLQITLADIAIFDGSDWISMVKPEELDKYPEIKALRAKVASADGIKQYLAKRKQTPF
ncbi:uncharacterized protein LOC101859624 [Aplysia californica]|uniref:Uncharacterized protein LOC101859624 n=1 Tax=Aplysia californica TaxID=6500 RepID=A0ABM0ZUK5_APLCA|nr:uncharacterized protein LOC101859624 [Aplysia californica]